MTKLTTAEVSSYKISIRSRCCDSVGSETSRLLLLATKRLVCTKYRNKIATASPSAPTKGAEFYRLIEGDEANCG